MNPIIQAMNPLGNLLQIKQMLRNPSAMSMLQADPRFRQFVESNRSKTPEQIASENGIDINQVYQLLR